MTSDDYLNWCRDIDIYLDRDHIYLELMPY